MPVPTPRNAKHDRRFLQGNRMGLGLALLPMVAAATLALAQQPGYSPNESQGYQALNDAGVATDPPSLVARVSVLQGNVSLEPASLNQFSAAETNYPMTTGDRIYADQGANAEIQTGQLAVRLGQQTDLTVTAMTDALAQFGLAQGSVHLRSFGLEDGETVELDTPNVAVTVLQPGDVRVDTDPSNATTFVTVLAGVVEVDGSGLQQQVGAGQALLVSGNDPVEAREVRRARQDGLDSFSADRDGMYRTALVNDGQYLNADTVGAEDLASYGNWENDGEDGPVWYPGGVAASWQPYVYGHWTWIAPWGWTWVGGEPWGFAPYHYGRWNRFGNRWGWVPGPVVVRPVYSPALVVFVGGGGTGVSAWFPLGPREAYVPWYHASNGYVNRVNVTNIYNRNTVEVRNIYNQRTTNVYGNVQGNQRAYVNRSAGTVAVSQASFAAGRPVAQSMVRVDPRQLAGAAVLPHPVVSPERAMVAGEPARALPPVQARPVLASHEDTRVRPSNAGRGTGTFYSGGAGTPVPAQGAVDMPQPARGREPMPQGGSPAGAVAEPRPAPGQMEREPRTQPVPPVREQPVPQPTQPLQQQRSLYNRAVPPEPRPGFDQQRQAMERSDPGRPLSAEQLNNVRQNAPVAAPAQREAPHAPAAAPMRTTPAPAPPPNPSPAIRPSPLSGDRRR